MSTVVLKRWRFLIGSALVASSTSALRGAGNGNATQQSSSHGRNNLQSSHSDDARDERSNIGIHDSLSSGTHDDSEQEQDGGTRHFGQRQLQFISSECAVNNPGFVGDGGCDQRFGYNTRACGWDGGDCCEDTCVPGRFSCNDQKECLDPNSSNWIYQGTCLVSDKSRLGDGRCDNDIEDYNTEACGYDMGDCCPDTCNDSVFKCNFDAPMVCLDPASPNSRGAGRVEVGPDCNVPFPSYLGDGFCDDALPQGYNTEECGYDGGDCCEDTCTPGDWPTGPNYDCNTPEAIAKRVCRDPNSRKFEGPLSTPAPTSFPTNFATTSAPTSFPTSAPTTSAESNVPPVSSRTSSPTSSGSTAPPFGASRTTFPTFNPTFSPTNSVTSGKPPAGVGGGREVQTDAPTFISNSDVQSTSDIPTATPVVVPPSSTAVPTTTTELSASEAPTSVPLSSTKLTLKPVPSIPTMTTESPTAAANDGVGRQEVPSAPISTPSPTLLTNIDTVTSESEITPNGAQPSSAYLVSAGDLGLLLTIFGSCIFGFVFY